MWENKSIKRKNLIRFINVNKLKPGEFAILGIKEASLPGEVSYVDLIFFNKNAK